MPSSLRARSRCLYLGVYNIAQLTKFAIAPSGDLVYRETGRKVTRKDVIVSEKVFENKKTKQQWSRTYVYDNKGRLIGQIGKPTKAQQARIEKADKNRVRRAKRAKVLESGAYNVPRLGESLAREDRMRGQNLNRPWSNWSEIYDRDVRGYKGQYYNAPTDRDIFERRKASFAKVLDAGLDSGKLSVDKARELWQKYLRSETEDLSADYDKVWNELNDYFDKEGYEYDRTSHSWVQKKTDDYITDVTD